MEFARFKRLVMLPAVIGAVALAGPAMAQQKPAQEAPKPAAPAPQKPAQGAPAMPTTAAPAPQPDWVKICPEKDQCVVGRDLRADTGQTVASVALPLSGPQGKKALRVQLPVGLLLVPGVQVVVDQNQPVRGRYVICFPNSCFAEVPITDAFFNTMKKGTNLVVQAASNATDGGQQPKTLNFPIGLDGLSKAIDGAPIDPKVFEAEKQKMNSELQKRAAEAREKLQMQGQGSGAPGSAPGIGGQAPVQAQ